MGYRIWDMGYWIWDMGYGINKETDVTYLRFAGFFGGILNLLLRDGWCFQLVLCKTIELKF